MPNCQQERYFALIQINIISDPSTRGFVPGLVVNNTNYNCVRCSRSDIFGNDIDTCILRYRPKECLLRQGM